VEIDVWTHGSVSRGALLVSAELDEYRTGTTALNETEVRILIHQLEDAANLLKQFLPNFKQAGTNEKQSHN